MGDRHRAVPVGIGLDDGSTRTPGPAASRSAARLPVRASRSTSIQAPRPSGGNPARQAAPRWARRALSARYRRRRPPRRSTGRRPRPPGARAAPSSACPRRPRTRAAVRIAAAPRSVPAAAGHRQRVREVRRQQAGVPDPLPDGLAGQAVQVHPEPRGVVRREALGEQRPDRARRGRHRSRRRPWPGSRTAPRPPTRRARRSPCSRP